jgi:WhiB family redox-sensing transcriptional regulator
MALVGEPLRPTWGTDDAWRDRAACRGHHDVFWPERVAGGWTYRDALAICAGCPVRDPCASYAHSVPDLTGVWGGRVIGVNAARTAKAIAAHQ